MYLTPSLQFHLQNSIWRKSPTVPNHSEKKNTSIIFFATILHSKHSNSNTPAPIFQHNYQLLSGPRAPGPEIQHSIVLLHLLWCWLWLCRFLLWFDEATREEVVVQLLVCEKRVELKILGEETPIFFFHCIRRCAELVVLNSYILIQTKQNLPVSIPHGLHLGALYSWTLQKCGQKPWVTPCPLLVRPCCFRLKKQLALNGERGRVQLYPNMFGDNAGGGETCWKIARENMDVSESSDTPKSSILIWFSIINHPFWDTHIDLGKSCRNNSTNWQFSGHFCWVGFPYTKNHMSCTGGTGVLEFAKM